MSFQTAGYEPSLPVTEKSNPITTDIDKADAKHIVHLLKNCDAEIFKKEWDAHGSYQVRFYSPLFHSTARYSQMNQK